MGYTKIFIPDLNTVITIIIIIVIIPMIVIEPSLLLGIISNC